MDDYVRRLVEALEELVSNLDEKLQELDQKKELFEKVSRFVAYINGDVHLVGRYPDQELVDDYLKKMNYNQEDYKACCYLLKNDDDNVKNLPQYNTAVGYMMDIIEFYKNLKVNLIENIQILGEECQKKRIEKKYYDMFYQDKLYVLDIREYEQFLDEHTTDISDKVNLLLFAIKKNVEKYQKEWEGLVNERRVIENIR